MPLRDSAQLPTEEFLLSTNNRALKIQRDAFGLDLKILRTRKDQKILVFYLLA
jgi:hypothetical protein